MVEAVEIPEGMEVLGMPLITDEEIERRIRLSGLPVATRRSHRFSSFRHRPALEDAWNFCYRYTKRMSDHPFLTLVGVPGTGKTHLALSIAWSWLEVGFGNVCYYQVGNLLNALRSGYDDSKRGGPEDTEVIRNYVSRCPLAVFDDLGAENVTAWAWTILDEIIDQRYINRLHTVVTTNEKPDRISERISDRLAEGKVLVLKADSWRRRKPDESNL